MTRLTITSMMLCFVLTLGGCTAPRGVRPASAGPAPSDMQAAITLPDGFRIDYFASDVPGARSLTRSPSGIVYVGTRREGNVYAVVDANGDQRAERVVTVASGLRLPNGVAWRDGSLYVAEISRILRYDSIDDRLDDPPAPVVIRDDFPTEQAHGWKFIAFGPDGDLYVPVGVPCNICEPPASIYGTITRMALDGSARTIIARGVRNTVGFDWQPGTGTLWFTDNGRDRMGDDLPPDELNRLGGPGQHFGFPYCHGADILDPEFGRGRSCDEFVAPARELGPHVAALGMRFYTGTMFPERWRGGIFIAEHGSWNRSVPIGYRITFVGVEGDQATSYEILAQGWLNSRTGEAWGRPVDVLVMPDGALLVSDDRAGAIYRISYEE